MQSDWVWLWVPITILAAALQTGRNAVQRGLTDELGTLGATQVRFVFGLPFACLFFLVAWVFGDIVRPSVSWLFLAFVLLGALSQIAATALMLAAMQMRDFVVVTVWTKTEPVQIALFGLIVLGEVLRWDTLLAICLATSGVVWMAWRPLGKINGQAVSVQPILLGLAAAAGFAVAAVGFRGAILALPEGNFLVRASWTLVCGLAIQASILAAYLMWQSPEVWRRCVNAWRISIWGGFLGAAASQAWFIGFALTTAANVRTLALVEVFFAQIVSRKLFQGRTTNREKIGMMLIVAGVGWLLWLQA
ncbi:MAG: EamA family transporter [Burkholderiaceae bacterium]|nr:EamA family transporter [Burkholderiaceae bacterium]MCD8517308.1 EamA family transporter [Burkholderiaceae bacterium]MCD8537609.1 EamA family transporter [Burkholderiaceae bacterium]MCD8566007.1 EamA family transporter [Burkholderiaceae bacterium]